jgi:hypothetical protein
MKALVEEFITIRYTGNSVYEIISISDIITCMSGQIK